LGSDNILIYVVFIAQYPHNGKQLAIWE